jgi:myosin heavy subunit
MNEVATRTPVMIAAEINSIKEQTRKLLIVNSIEIGRRLSEAKSLLPHGEWGKWLEESVDYSQRTANNLMKVFQQYGDDQLALFGTSLKSQSLANLSYTQAVALLSVPEDERETFVQENNVEEMSTRELQKAIKEKEELQIRLDKISAKAELGQKELKTTSGLLSKQLEISYKLKEQLKTAQVTGDDEAIKSLQDKLDASEQRQKELNEQNKNLQKQLKEKPIDVPVTKVVEKIPDEIVAEIAELRKASAPGGKEAMKFQVCFDHLVSGFRDLLTSLNDIPDADMKKKYSSAVSGLLEKMGERL